MHASRPLSIAACLLAGCSAMGWEGDPRADGLRAYKQSFHRALGSTWQQGPDPTSLERELRTRRILFLGDDHRDQALHQLHRDLLAGLLRRGQRLALVLEAIGSQDDLAVQDFLRGTITLPALRVTVAARWPGSWLDSADVDAPHYRELLAMAARGDTPVHGLEPTPRLPLARRDAAMAQRLRALAAQHPDRLLVVVVGQSHLLGQGDLIRRVGLPALAFGARPSAELGPVPAAVPGPLPRSEGGLLFFRVLTPPGPAPLNPGW